MRTRLPVICCVLAIALAASITHAQDFVWAKQMGGTRFDYGEAVAVDSSGNTYATGIFEGTSTFGSSILNSAGFQDIFVEKLAPDGAVQWAKRMGGTLSNDEGHGIAVDASGNVYVTGRFAATADFGPYVLTSAGNSYDGFVVKLDPNGAVQWAKRMGGGNCRLGSCSCLRCKRESLRNWIFYWYSGL